MSSEPAADNNRDVSLRQQPHVNHGSPRHMIVALDNAAREVGCPTSSFTAIVREFPAGVAACWRLPAFAEQDRGRQRDRQPVTVRVDLRAPRRKAVNEMIEKIVEAGGHDWYRPTDPGAIYGPMRAQWEQISAAGPQTEGLAQRLHDLVDLGDPHQHPALWFRRVASDALAAAYHAGAPVNLTGCVILDSGSGVAICGDGPGYDKPSVPAIGVAAGFDKATTVENAVEAILWGHGMVPGDDGYYAKAAHMRAAMTAASVDIPDTAAELCR